MEQYLDSIIDVSGLVNDLDFEIISILVMDNEYNAYSLGGFLGSTSNQLYEGKTGFLVQAKGLIKVHGKEKDVLWVAPTLYTGGDNVKFYKLKSDIDVDIASEVGLGVVMYQGELMIYSPQPNNDPIDAIYEMIKLKVYLQLMHPENLDIKL
ncbi:hypothetical protein [Paenibacillus aquistagni]|uniref:hypothetical protein n=1 Tax=Paenibacillus aquistagni TaxID=1852522 RepID=UPI0011305355|nr:hypothetical protein [Paenibacillus aquistagni]